MVDKLIDEQKINLVNLPKMVVASISMAEEEPEDGCWNEILKLIKDYDLDLMADFRTIGHGYNDINGSYLYELWVTIPKDFQIFPPFVKKEFSGGLYASLSANLSNIGDKWQELQELVSENGIYEHDTNPIRDMYLEECIDIKHFHSTNILSGKQLTLLLPVILTNKNQNKSIVKEIKSIEVTLPDLVLGGINIILNEKVKPWKKRVPWYLLAQNIYKVGPGFNECMNHGNNTFTLIYGNTINQLPFYLDLNKGILEKVFAAVELVKSFPFYPDGLEEYKLSSKKYIKFSIEIDPKDAKSTKLTSKELYQAASFHFKCKEDNVIEEYCLEREYRADGRYVDKIELYVPIKL